VHNGDGLRVIALHQAPARMGGHGYSYLTVCTSMASTKKLQPLIAQRWLAHATGYSRNIAGGDDGGLVGPLDRP
jgi:hypothetical protein